ncbi:unnamed protein product [Aphanomyces euteiches]
MQSIVQRVRKAQRKYEKHHLPAIKKEQVVKRLQELSSQPETSGFCADAHTLQEHLEQSHSLSSFLAGRFHDIYVVNPESRDDKDNEGSEEEEDQVVLSTTVVQSPPTLPKPKTPLEPLVQLPHARTTKNLTLQHKNDRRRNATPPLLSSHSSSNMLEKTSVERKLPPLFYRLQPVWSMSFTSSMSEEELLGLPTAENARMVFGLDIYEAKGIARLFNIHTPESLYQLYSKERIYGREGQMRDNMTRAVYSSRTTTRVMAILKQIDSFSIFLDAKPKKSALSTLSLPSSSLREEKTPSTPSQPHISTNNDTLPASPEAALASGNDLPTTDDKEQLAKTDPLVDPSTTTTAAAAALTPSHSSIDFVEIYIHHCALHQVLPSKRVVAQLAASVVDCSHFDLSAFHVVALAHALAWNADRLVELHLGGNWSEESGGDALAQLVASCPKLSVLDLANNRIGTRSAVRLVDAVALSSSVTLLNLRGNHLLDRIHGAIGRLLRASPLRTLDLSDNKLRDKTGRAIGAALAANSSLETLSMTWNTMSSIGSGAILHALEGNTSLTSLSLGWNRVGHDGGCNAAAMLLRSQTLRALDLSYAHLTAVSVGLLADALAFNATLETLQLDQNTVDETAVARLMHATMRESNAPPIHVSLERMVYTHAQVDGDVALNSLDPSGYYRLHLKQATDRTVFELLKRRAERHLGAFHHIFVHETKWDARHLHRIAPTAVVRFEFVATTATAMDKDAIHFRLDLTNPRDRATAAALIARATMEKGENWMHETLDGVPFQFDELSASASWLAEHPNGVLELDYVTTSLCCERHYKLDLALKSDRAMAWKLLERVQRSQRPSLVDRGDEWRNLQLDGAPLSLSAWEVPAKHSAATYKWKWRVPLQGTIEFDFYTPRPHHVVAQHYRLDLADPADRVLAHRLRVRSLECIGECWWNEEIDGYPFRLAESLEQDFDFPRRGMLDFDFILLRPAHCVHSMTVHECKLNLADYDDYLHAEFLRRVAAMDSHHYVWTNAAISSRPYVMSQAMLPPEGVLTFHGLIFQGADAAADDAMAFLLQQLDQFQDDFERQKFMVDVACGGHHHNSADDRGPMFLTSAMVPRLLALFATDKEKREIIMIIWPNVLDKANLARECIALQSDGAARWFGAASFEAFAASCLERFLAHRLHLNQNGSLNG